MSLTRIPIFPLGVVLFPGVPLPLHIFEPRYKHMIRECLDAQSEFGVVLAREDGIARIGCTAQVVKIIKTYPDGRMDILTAGQNIFRISEVFQEKPYFEASVEILENESGAAPEGLLKQISALFESCYQLIYGRTPPLPEPASGADACHWIASELPLDLDAKQEILEELNTAVRAERLLKRLEILLPELRRIEAQRKRAGGNGHRRA